MLSYSYVLCEQHKTLQVIFEFLLDHQFLEDVGLKTVQDNMNDVPCRGIAKQAAWNMVLVSVAL